MSFFAVGRGRLTGLQILQHWVECSCLHVPGRDIPIQSTIAGYRRGAACRAYSRLLQHIRKSHRARFHRLEILHCILRVDSGRDSHGLFPVPGDKGELETQHISDDGHELTSDTRQDRSLEELAFMFEGKEAQAKQNRGVDKQLELAPAVELESVNRENQSKA